MKSELETDRSRQCACPKCGDMINVKNLGKHMLKHEPANEALQLANGNYALLKEARERFLATKVVCTVCKDKVAVSKIPAHFQEKHGTKSLPQDMRALFQGAEIHHLFQPEHRHQSAWIRTAFKNNDELTSRPGRVLFSQFEQGKRR